MKEPAMRILALIPLLALGACTLALAPPSPGPGPVAAPAGSATGGDTGPAVAACRAAAAEQGLSVRGVDSVSEVRGSDGLPAGQNVFLDVTRGGSGFVLRCSYSNDSAEARIMTL
jgi:hypothetical protein